MINVEKFERDIDNLDMIAQAAESMFGKIVRTPSIKVEQTGLQALLPEGSRVTMKLELLQKAGSFKARGSLLSIEALTEEQLKNGVVAASGGNHALAVSWAAREVGTSAKITVPRTADPVRIEGCRKLGAEVMLYDTIHEAFDMMHVIEEDEGRHAIHPYEGFHMSLGAATIGLELFAAAPDLDIVILPVGGGGLISGMSTALKLLNPKIEIYGIEPFGADSMHRSFAAGSAQKIDKVTTIADSLGAPHALPYSYSLARANVDDILRVTDDELRDAMRAMNTSMKLMAEPACAASLAGALGPLREKCEGKSVGLIACGSNINPQKFVELIG